MKKLNKLHKIKDDKCEYNITDTPKTTSNK